MVNAKICGMCDVYKKSEKKRRMMFNSRGIE